MTCRISRFQDGGPRSYYLQMEKFIELWTNKKKTRWQCPCPIKRHGNDIL